MAEASAKLPCAELNCFGALVPILLGSLITCTALGALLICALRLPLKPFTDGRIHWRRCVVLGVLTAQTLETALEMAKILQAYALHFGDLEYLAIAHWESAAAFGLGVTIQATCQTVFLERAVAYSIVLRVPAWLKRTAGALLFIAILAYFGLGMAVLGQGVIAAHRGVYTSKPIAPELALSLLYSRLVIAWALLGASIDLLLATAMTKGLLAASKRTNGLQAGKRLRRALQRLRRIVVESGIALTAAQTFTAIVWIAFEATHSRLSTNVAWVWLPFLLLPSLYTATLLRFSSSVHKATRPEQVKRRSPGIDAEAQYFSTVEYDWGKVSSDGTGGDGVPCVAGLPLDATSPANSIHLTPNSASDEECLVPSTSARHLRQTSSFSSQRTLTSKPSLSTILEHGAETSTDERISPFLYPTSTPSQVYHSPFHSPRVLEAGQSSNPFDALHEGQDVDSYSAHSRSRLLGKFVDRSHSDDEELGEDGADGWAGRSRHRMEISDPRPSESAIAASCRLRSRSCSSSRSPSRSIPVKESVKRDSSGAEDEESYS